MANFHRFVFGITLSLCFVSLSEDSLKAQEETEVQVQQETTATIESVEKEGLASATTTEDLQIPTDELRLLIKPLFLKELELEADAWLLLLRNKVEEISNLEITIKRQNNFIARQEEALQALESARTTLEEAQAEQENATPGTPEYEKATEKVEAAQESLEEARTALREAATEKQGIIEDADLTASLEKAAETRELDAAKTALNEARTSREEMAAGSETYEQITQQINTLDTAIAQFEEAQETLSGVNPEAEEYALATRNFEKAKQDLIEAREELEGSGMIAELETANRLIGGAKSAQENLNPGTAAYQQATENITTLESAIAAYQEARQVRRQADVENGEAYDQALQTLNKAEQDLLEAIAEAQGAGAAEEISIAQETLEEAKQNRETLDPETQAYQQATERIETLESAIAAFEQAREARQQANSNAPNYEELVQASKQAQQDLEIARQEIVLDETATDSEQGNNQATQAQQAEIQAAVERLQAVMEAVSEQKNQLVITVTDLQGERTAIIDRLSVILNELERKGGDVQAYHNYIKSAGGVEIDFTDTQGLGVRLITWLTSEEGGLRWIIRGGVFITIIAGSLIASFVAGSVINGGLSKFENISQTLRMLVVRTIRIGIIAFGSLYALTIWGFSLGPILALVGGVSFVLAFALQSNLGNVASGLMLMAYKPFDIGDQVMIPGSSETGTVEAITLANTAFRHYSGKIVTLPNAAVWGARIENLYPGEERLIEFKIPIKSTDDGVKIRDIWNQLTSEHADILQDKSIADGPSLSSSGTLVWWCRAWAKKEGFLDVYGDLLIKFQEALREAEISFGIHKEEHHIHFVSDHTKSKPSNGHHSLPSTSQSNTESEVTTS